MRNNKSVRFFFYCNTETAAKRTTAYQARARTAESINNLPQHLTKPPKYDIITLSNSSSTDHYINLEEEIMMSKINKAIAQNGIWIFLVAALYKFTFWIINMVSDFKWGAASGVRTLFSGLFGMVLDLVILAVILEVSRKIAEKYTAADFANNPFAPPTANNYNAAPQAPVQQAGNFAAPNNGAWFCAGCGTQNDNGTSFCAKCGKPK